MVVDLTSFNEVNLSPVKVEPDAMCKVQEIDELLGTIARLAIVLTLANGKTWTFTALRDETGLADGNLHVQTRKLVAAEYVSSEKSKSGKRLVTTFKLTPHGRERLKDHVERVGQYLGIKSSGAEDSQPVPIRKKQIQNDGSQVW